MSEKSLDHPSGRWEHLRRVFSGGCKHCNYQECPYRGFPSRAVSTVASHMLERRGTPRPTPTPMPTHTPMPVAPQASPTARLPASPALVLSPEASRTEQRFPPNLVSSLVVSTLRLRFPVNSRPIHSAASSSCWRLRIPRKRRMHVTCLHFPFGTRRFAHNSPLAQTHRPPTPSFFAAGRVLSRPGPFRCLSLPRPDCPSVSQAAFSNEYQQSQSPSTFGLAVNSVDSRALGVFPLPYLQPTHP